MPDVNYDFYVNDWGGVLPEPIFNQYLVRAQLALNCITKGRIDKIWDRLLDADKDAIRMALCALVDDFYNAAQTGGKNITSETVGQHHVSYQQETRSRQIQLRDLVKIYLCGLSYNGASLLYRGIDRRCCWC